MAGGKETPRQKMIGMMYLVLTALLALNVSKSILDAFVTIDEQSLAQNTNLVQSVNGIGTKISALLIDEQSKKTAQEIEPIYKNVLALSNRYDDNILVQLNELIAQTEESVIAEEGAKFWFTKTKSQITKFIPLDKMQSKDNYDNPTAFFGGEPGSEADKRGKKLRTDLMRYRDELILMIADSIKDDKGKIHRLDQTKMSSFSNNPSTFEKYLESEGHPYLSTLTDIYVELTKREKIEQHEELKDWNFARFYHQPMIGVISTVTSLRNDIRSAELKGAKMLLSKIDKPMMNINKIEAKVLANAQYFNVGDKVDIKIGIIAYDSTKKYEAEYRTSNTGEYSVADSGTFTLSAGSPGNKTVEGNLIVDIAGVPTKKPFSFEYTVGKPSASIASPELNVMYAGYDNKIQAIASGYPPNEVKVSCSGCKSFSKGNKGVYVAKVGNTKTTTVTVTAGGKKIGFQEFRVMPLPKPQPYYAGKTYGQKTIKSGALRQGLPLSAKLTNSPLNVLFSVKGFTLDVLVNGKILSDKSNSGKLTGKMKNMLKNAKKGQKVYFYDVLVAGPNGKRKPIGGLTFKVM